jgi:hypothetical protein
MLGSIFRFAVSILPFRETESGSLTQPVQAMPAQQIQRADVFSASAWRFRLAAVGVLFAVVLRVLLLDRPVGFVVVLVVVDLLAGVVLLMIYLGLFLRRQLSAVGSAIVMNLVVDVGFLIFQVPGFLWR